MPTNLFPLGGRIDKSLLATKIPKLNLNEFFDVRTANPFLRKLRVEQGFLPQEAMPRRFQLSPDGGAPSRPSSVDWRNRFGINWLPTIQNQSPCESCWAYATTALIESMVRIQHNYWCKLSEADLHDGREAKCADGGNVGDSLAWAKVHGIADYGCYADNKDDKPYKPSWDRSGRIVKVGDHTDIGDINQQKDWLDKVGPLAAFLEVWSAFDRYELNAKGACFNHKKDGDKDRGGHLILIVGYDDILQAWLIRNSWGTNWGVSGYGWIGYGEFDIDLYAKTGITDVNPSPITKRGYQNGAMVESGNGAQHRNFELMVKFADGKLQHFWRQGGENGNYGWHGASIIANNALSQPTMIQTSYNRNMELVFVNTNSMLQHQYYDQSSGKWLVGPAFGGSNFDGVPGLVQSNRMAPGNFELVCRTKSGQLKHFWRENAGPWTWHDGSTFGSNISFSGASLVQNPRGNLDVVCVNNDGTMQVYWLNNGPTYTWTPAEKFGANLTSAPCMIQGNFGMRDEKAWGNYELCIAGKDGKIQHWWRDNSNTAALIWRKSAEFGTNIKKVVAFLQGSFGGNLELIALAHDGHLHAFHRDGNGWHDDAVIL